MTVVKCRNLKCKYNKWGVCTADEIVVENCEFTGYVELK